MNPPTAALEQPAAAPRITLWKRVLDSRFMPPVLITLILLVGNASFGILEGYQKTLLAIVASIVTEMVLGRIFLRRWPHPASAYITGISAGILLRSPAYWPFALCAASPSLQSMCCASAEGTSGIPRISAFALCCSSHRLRWRD